MIFVKNVVQPDDPVRNLAVSGRTTLMIGKGGLVSSCA
jgi:hypothetical protein